MVTWCHHLPADNGFFYALKGVLPQDEIDGLPQGLAVEKVIPLSVPELEGERHLVIIRPKKN